MDDKIKIPLNADEQELTEQETQAAKENTAADADKAPKAKNGKAKKAAGAADETADTPAEKEPTEAKAGDGASPAGEKKTYKAEKLPPKPPKSQEQLEWEAARREKFNRTVWQPIIRPIVVLVVICLVTSLLLGLTNMVTEPIIAANTEAEANAARQALLPDADSFTQLQLSGEYSNVSAIYAADNGAGWVADAAAKGYGGDVPVMVAFGADGSIAGVTFLQNNETPGLGKKLETDKSFREQFAGRPAESIAMSSIDKIASSTISTGAAVSAINAAIEAFNAEVQGISSGAMTPEEVRASLLPDATLEAIVVPDGTEGVQPTAWRDNATGNVIAYGEAKGVHSTVVAAVAVDPDGVILNLWLDTSGETEGMGEPVQKDTAFIQSFTGLTDPQQADNVAGGTLTCNAAKEAVANVLAIVPQLADAPADPAGGTENTTGDNSTGGGDASGATEDDGSFGGLSPEEVAAQLVPDEAFSRFGIVADGVENMGLVSETDTYILYGYAEGKESTVTVAVALDADGAILGILPDVSGETPDVGGLVPDDTAFMDAFAGATSTDGIDTVAGATLTSGAILEAVDNALAAFASGDLPTGGDYLTMNGMTRDEVGEALLPGESFRRKYIIGSAGTDGIALLSDAGNYVIFGHGDTFDHNGVPDRGMVDDYMIVAVAMDAEGTILGLLPDVSDETPEVGGQVPDNADFMDAFIGRTNTEGIEPVAGASITSGGIIGAVDNALRALPDFINAQFVEEVG